LSEFLKSALKAEKTKPDQLNLEAYWYCHSYCASASYLYGCFSSLSKREFFDRVSEVKAAQQLMLNAHKRQHA